MVGLVIASHGRLAEELVATAMLIVGEVPGVATCSVEPGTAPDEIKQRLKRAVVAVEDGQGVIVFADLVGGSPCMHSLSLCRSAAIEVITGVNLPMLLKANTARHEAMPLKELAKVLTAYGQRNITCASESVRDRTAGPEQE